MTAATVNVYASVHVHGDDPFRVGMSRDAAHITAGGADIYIESIAQADSLIRAAVAAKDMLIAAQVTA